MHVSENIIEFFYAMSDKWMYMYTLVVITFHMISGLSFCCRKNLKNNKLNKPKNIIRIKIRERKEYFTR